MPVLTETIQLRTKPDTFYNITDKVEKVVRKAGLDAGYCLIFCPGSTAAVILNESDPALLRDLRNVLEKAAPERALWHHPDNAQSHVRAVLLGPGQTVPIKNGKLLLGTWQQILLYEGDITPRSRSITVTILE
jgi:secondary thiamine-phosphate synthase enzyme